MAKRKAAAEPDYAPPMQGGSYVRKDDGELERVEGPEAAAEVEDVEDPPAGADTLAGASE